MSFWGKGYFEKGLSLSHEFLKKMDFGGKTQNLKGGLIFFGKVMFHLL